MGVAILDDEFVVSEETLLCAFEYAVGRKSYVVGNVVRDLLENAELLTSKTRQLIIKNISEKWSVNCLGEDSDRSLWVDLLHRLQEIEAEA